MPARWSDADYAQLGAVYELQCTSRMSAIYYEMRLARLMTISFWMEVVTAATASGSGLLAVLNDSGGWGHMAWQILALTAALVAIIKPIYAPSKKIEVFTRQQQGYHANFYSLKKLSFAIRQEGAVSEAHRRHYDTVFDRHVQLSTEDENVPVQRLVKIAQDRTAHELPPSSFWFPEAGPAQPEEPPAPTAAAAPESTEAGATAAARQGVIQLKTS
jgi:hypothetical protein